MRSLPTLSILIAALLFCAVGTAQAQIDTRTMSERFTQPPNYNLKYTDPSIKGFDSRSFLGAGSYAAKPFAFLKGFSSKEYKSKAYNSSNYWAGNFKYKTSDADVKTRGPLSGLLRLFKTKPANVATASVASKTFGDSRAAPLVAEKKNAVFRGKIQKKINKEGPAALAGSNPLEGEEGGSGVDTITIDGDPHPVESNGNLHPMTLDDVRALLGK